MEEDSSSQTPQEFQLPYQSVPIEDQNKRTHLDELHQIGKKTSGSNNINPLNISMAPPILPWPPIHQIGDHEIGQFYPSMHPHVPPPPFLHEFYTMRASTALQFGYEGIDCVGPSSSDPLGLASQYFGGFASTSSPYIGKMSPQEIIDAKALAASKNHSEAERRRRERINAHLSKLRSMLPNTTKTDKASLLAEVIQHVKELKRQTSEIAEESPLPTECDELIVDTLSRDDDGHFVIRASLCCEDRSDLLPDLIKTLKSLHLRALKAEITTLAGRVKNVLLITGDETSCVECGDSGQSEQSSMPHQHSLVSIQEALREVMERPTSIDEGSGGSGTKRQRTASVVDLS